MRAQIQKTAAPVKSSDLETAELLSGIESGGGMANKLHGTPMAYGAGIGGAAGLLREYMRHKSEAEKAQPAWRKVLRYAGQGGLGALAGTGVGGVAGHLLSNAVTDQASNDKYKALYKAHREQTDLSKTTNGWVPKPPHVMDIAQGIDDKSNALSEAVLGKALSGKSGSAKIAELKLAPLPGMKKPDNDKGMSLNNLLEEARKTREEKEKNMPQQNKAASALLEALKEAAATPEYRKAHKAQNRARYAALLKADGGRSRSFTGANPALLDAHHYKYVKDRWASDKEDMKWDAADGGNRTEKAIARANAKPEQTKASALEFGKMAARGDMAKKTLGRSVQAPKRGRQRAGELAGRLNQARNDNKGSASYTKKIEALQGSMRRQPPESLTALANGLSMWVDRSPAGLASYAKDVQLGQQQAHQKFLDYTGGLRPSNFDAMPAPTFTTPGEKIGSALEFGTMLKRSFDFNSISSGIQTGLNNAYEGAKNIYNSKGVQNFVNDPTTRAGLTYGGIGAGLGGLYGLINPGEYEDEMGNVRRRGRLSGALRGALGGGALGGLAGAGAQEGRFQYLKHMMNQRAGFPNAMGGLDRGEALENAEAFAQNNPSAVGALGTSPLQGAQNAYSAASNAVSNYMPKRMGKAPAIGVETPAKAPEVKKTDEQA